MNFLDDSTALGESLDRVEQSNLGFVHTCHSSDVGVSNLQVFIYIVNGTVSVTQLMA